MSHTVFVTPDKMAICCDFQLHNQTGPFTSQFPVRKTHSKKRVASHADATLGTSLDATRTDATGGKGSHTETLANQIYPENLAQRQHAHTF